MMRDSNLLRLGFVTLLAISLVSLRVEAQVASTSDPSLPVGAEQRRLADLQSLVAPLMDQANFWQFKGNTSSAESVLVRLLEIDGNNEKALGMLGQMQAEDGNFKATQATLARIKALNPNNPDMTRISITLQNGQGDRDVLAAARKFARENKLADAVRLYEQLFKGAAPTPSLALEYYQALGNTDRGFPKAMDGILGLARAYPGDLNLALALAQLQTYREDSRSEGISTLQKLATKPEVASAATQLWRQALLWEPDGDSTKPELERFLVLHPQDPQILKKLQAKSEIIVDVAGQARLAGFKALQEHKLSDAETEFNKALALNPQDPNALGGLGLTRVYQKRLVEGRDLLARAAAEEPTWEAALKDSRAMLAGTDNHAGTAIQARYLRVQSLTASGRYVEAAQLLTQLMGRRGNAGSYTQLGSIQARAGQLDTAEASYRKAALLNPRDPNPILGLASVLERSGRLADAQVLLAQAESNHLVVGTAHAEMLRRLAAMQVNPAQRMDLLQQAIRSSPSEPWSRMELAQMLDKQNRHAEARLVMQGVGDGPRPTPESLQAAIAYAQGRGDIVAAGAFVARLPEQSLTPDLRDVTLHATLLGEIARNNDGSGSATNNLLRMAAIPDPKGQRVVEIAHQFMKNHNRDAAQRAISTAMDTNRNLTTQQRLAYAGVLMELDSGNSAAMLLRSVRSPDLNANDRVTYDSLQNGLAIRRSAVLLQKGDAQKATVALAGRINVNPAEPDLQKALAQAYLSDQKPNAALRMSEDVIAKFPTDLDARRVAVQAALRIENYTKANALVAEALQIAPEDPRSSLMVADVAHAHGNRQNELTALERARSLRLRQIGETPSEGGGQNRIGENNMITGQSSSRYSTIR